MKILFISLSTIVLFASCGASKTENAETPKADSIETATTDLTPKEDNSLADPFKDFPKDPITAASGDMCFASLDVFNPGNKDKKFEEINITFVDHKITDAGAEFTKIENFGKLENVPNYFVIPIKSAQTAKKGDIVLAPWHHGNSMMRAVVIDDKDPAKPIVNFIDIDWNNPAKGDKGIGYGQEETQLQPNTFHVIESAWEAGTTIAVRNGQDWMAQRLIKIGADKVMVLDNIGRITIVKREYCKGLEVKPSFKVGDEVMAPWVGKFVKTKVQKIDTKYGRVYVTDPFSDKALVVAFGTVAKPW